MDLIDKSRGFSFAILTGTSEAVPLMQPPTTPDQNKEATPPAPMRRMVTEPDFTGTPQSIVEFVSRADFPHCLLGAHIDIQGFAGVVVEIVKESIRVRPPEGMTQRFN